MLKPVVVNRRVEVDVSLLHGRMQSLLQHYRRIAHFTALQMHGLLLDLRCASRALLRRSYFSATAVMMLSVGVGASAAFSLSLTPCC